MYGTWEGTYTGNLNSTKVERKLKLNIDNCTGNGTVEGFATIDEGKNGSYFFSGSIDFETGEISFEGTDWINNPSGFGFASFSGTLQKESAAISGEVDNDSGKTFHLTRTSEQYETKQIKLNQIPRDWSGEYDGVYNSTVVRRNYEFHITELNEDGTVKGTAILSPSEKANAAYAANGSYLFKGTIDARRGKIKMQGYEWTDYPLGYDNFSFVKLEGFFDLSSGKIDGTSENGIWEMHAINYDNVNVISGFSLGKDNNSYVHTNDEKWDGAGFAGLNNYEISDEFYEKLTQNATKGDKNKIKKQMKSEWGGSCYGIAATMGLLYEGRLGLSDLADVPASDYHSLPKPCDNEKFLNTINYYYLSQFLTNGGTDSIAVSSVYNYGIFSGLVNWACDKDSLSVFLKKLVSYTSNNHVEMFTYSTDEGGHAVLITGCEYDAENEQYRVTVYDENSVLSSTDNGAFTYMTVAKDFSSFSYCTPNGTEITDQSFRSLYFMDWSKMANLTSQVSTTQNTDYVYIDFPIHKPFKATVSDGKYLVYDGEKFSGTLPIYAVQSEYKDDESRITIGTSETGAVILSDLGTDTDIEISSKDSYMAIDVKNLQGATLSFQDGITLSGSAYSFQAYISTENDVKNNESGLVSIKGDANADVRISSTGENVILDSDGKVQNVSATSYIGTETKTNSYGQNVGKMTLDINKIGEKKKPVLKFSSKKVTKTYGNKAFKNKLQIKTDGKIKYTSSNKKVATVDKNGKVTIRGVGTATIKVTVSAGKKYRKGSAGYTLKVNPKGTAIASITSKSRGFAVNLKKQTQKTTGYQIQYSEKKNFKNAKTVKITKNRTVKKTVSKLRGKKTYYVRVRTYTKVSGKTYYSSWSKAKTVKTKK